MAKKDAAENGSPAPGAWAPPKGAQQLELAEFFKFTDKGEAVLGRISRITERQDPANKDRVMRGLVLSPAIVINTKGQRAAYRTLAIGLSAHLELLIGEPGKSIGAAYGFQYDGKRAGERGKNPSHQFNLFALSEQQLKRELFVTDPEHAELLMQREPADAGAGDDDDLPF